MAVAGSWGALSGYGPFLAKARLLSTLVLIPRGRAEDPVLQLAFHLPVNTSVIDVHRGGGNGPPVQTLGFFPVEGQRRLGPIPVSGSSRGCGFG